MNRRSPINVGGASLFAVLIILCLTVFAVLAKLSADSEKQLAIRTADSIQAYYDADYRAVLRLFEVTVSGEFVEEIDANRELKVVYIVTEDGIFIEEWAAVGKTDRDNDNSNTENLPGLILFED
ncbi:MAG: hypothetical protein FWD34_02505 [Oscillospiraceae bacterium]|nr:hypothetical protein [Oscillospiraceae bacterium]